MQNLFKVEERDGIWVESVREEDMDVSVLHSVAREMWQWVLKTEYLFLTRSLVVWGVSMFQKSLMTDVGVFLPEVKAFSVDCSGKVLVCVRIGDWLEGRLSVDGFKERVLHLNALGWIWMDGFALNGKFHVICLVKNEFRVFSSAVTGEYAEIQRFRVLFRRNAGLKDIRVISVHERAFLLILTCSEILYQRLERCSTNAVPFHSLSLSPWLLNPECFDLNEYYCVVGGDSSVLLFRLDLTAKMRIEKVQQFDTLEKVSGVSVGPTAVAVYSVGSQRVQWLQHSNSGFSSNVSFSLEESVVKPFWTSSGDLLVLSEHQKVFLLDPSDTSVCLLYASTDSLQFIASAPSVGAILLLKRVMNVQDKALSYRIALILKKAPLEVMERYIALHWYDKAIQFATRFSLDTDIVLKAKWEASAVTEESVKILIEVKDKRWALHQSLTRTADTIKDNIALIRFGIAESVGFHEELVVLYQMNTLLTAWKQSMTTFDPLKFVALRDKGLPLTSVHLREFCIDLAVECNFLLIGSLFELFWWQLSHHALDILSNIPETESSLSFSMLLPPFDHFTPISPEIPPVHPKNIKEYLLDCQALPKSFTDTEIEMWTISRSMEILQFASNPQLATEYIETVLNRFTSSSLTLHHQKLLEFEFYVYNCDDLTEFDDFIRLSVEEKIKTCLQNVKGTDVISTWKYKVCPLLTAALLSSKETLDATTLVLATLETETVTELLLAVCKGMIDLGLSIQEMVELWRISMSHSHEDVSRGVEWIVKVTSALGDELPEPSRILLEEMMGPMKTFAEYKFKVSMETLMGAQKSVELEKALCHRFVISSISRLKVKRYPKVLQVVMDLQKTFFHHISRIDCSSIVLQVVLSECQFQFAEDLIKGQYDFFMPSEEIHAVLLKRAVSLLEEINSTVHPKINHLAHLCALGRLVGGPMDDFDGIFAFMDTVDILNTLGIEVSPALLSSAENTFEYLKMHISADFVFTSPVHLDSWLVLSEVLGSPQVDLLVWLAQSLAERNHFGDALEVCQIVEKWPLPELCTILQCIEVQSLSKDEKELAHTLQLRFCSECEISGILEGIHCETAVEEEVMETFQRKKELLGNSEETVLNRLILFDQTMHENIETNSSRQLVELVHSFFPSLDTVSLEHLKSEDLEIEHLFRLFIENRHLLTYHIITLFCIESGISLETWIRRVLDEFPQLHSFNDETNAFLAELAFSFFEQSQRGEDEFIAFIELHKDSASLLKENDWILLFDLLPSIPKQNVSYWFSQHFGFSLIQKPKDTQTAHEIAILVLHNRFHEAIHLLYRSLPITPQLYDTRFGIVLLDRFIKQASHYLNTEELQQAQQLLNSVSLSKSPRTIKISENTRD